MNWERNRKDKKKRRWPFCEGWCPVSNGTPTHTEWHNARIRKNNVACFHGQSNTVSDQLAMIVLARHAARLGQSAKGLEEVLTRWGTGCWAFLADPKGQTAYSDIKQQFAQIYDQRCRYPLEKHRF